MSNIKCELHRSYENITRERRCRSKEHTHTSIMSVKGRELRCEKSGEEEAGRGSGEDVFGEEAGSHTGYALAN